MQQLLEYAEPLAKTMGLEVLLAEATKIRGDKGFRIYLDQASGIKIEDCEKFSRALAPVLDIEAGWEGQYSLEVSSPGLNRPLVQRQHFEAQIGNIIQVKTTTSLDGRHQFKGTLIDVTKPEEILTLKVDQQEFKIPIKQIKKASLDYFASEAEHNLKPKKGK